MFSILNLDNLKLNRKQIEKTIFMKLKRVGKLLNVPLPNFQIETNGLALFIIL